jgi:membrane protein DedA with SNARE-associated domain
MELIHEVADWLVNFVNHFGYMGIFIMTTLESTFVPLPSEVTMVPAGYLVHQGEMMFVPVLLVSIAGTLAGSYFNYWLAKRYGRGLFLRYGKYFLMPPEKLEKMEKFFVTHGAISIFTGRLIFGVRHFISFPAGLAKMKLKSFFIYTALGSSIWMSILLVLGYAIGEHKELVIQYLPLTKIGMLVLVLIGIIPYALRHRKKKGEA